MGWGRGVGVLSMCNTARSQKSDSYFLVCHPFHSQEMVDWRAKGNMSFISSDDSFLMPLIPT